MKFKLIAYAVDRMTHKWQWPVKLVLVLICGLAWGNQAYACNPVNINVSAPKSLNINPSLPVGSTLGTINVTFGNFDLSGGCRDSIVEDFYNVLWEFLGTGVANGNLYPTTIPGLSYRGKYTYMYSIGMGGYWPTSGMIPVGGTSVPSSSIVIEFVKTGSMAAGGSFGPQVLMTWKMASLPVAQFSLATTIIIKPTANACTITQSAIQVNLDPVSVSKFTSAGVTANDKAFTIPINCTSPANIALSFDGTLKDASKGVFQNTNSSNAENIGIQLLDSSGSPVTTTVGQYANVGQITGPYNYPMTARYYSLTSDVPTGDVSAIAYATIIYN
ncbi:MAG: fimbrial protein [Serratia sp. (in: enterobacteria)]|uniref:fimbrial protein n=1 Tax=Serratia sp. (in: enterobacteria) TaxID=616 RepID=UPI003F313752